MIAVLDPLAPAPGQVPPVRTIPRPRKKKRTIRELMDTISPSRLTAWLGCRLKFYFRYVSGISKPPSASMHAGTVVHKVLQEWSRARWRWAPMSDEAILAEFEKAWSTQRDDDEPVNYHGEEAEEKASALSTLLMYLRDSPIPFDEKPEAVEVGVEMKLGLGLPTLVGIIDLVRAGGRLVDYKTTGKTPNPEKVLHTHEIQTTSYGILYRDSTGQRETGIELHHLVKLKTPKLVVTEVPPVTDAQIARFHRLVDSYVDGLSREDFVPSPGMQCSSCEFFNECRRWK